MGVVLPSRVDGAHFVCNTCRVSVHTHRGSHTYWHLCVCVHVRVCACTLFYQQCSHLCLVVQLTQSGFRHTEDSSGQSCWKHTAFRRAALGIKLMALCLFLSLSYKVFQGHGAYLIIALSMGIYSFPLDFNASQSAAEYTPARSVWECKWSRPTSVSAS